MSPFLEKVADQLNLRWAWEKVRREAFLGDVLLDEIELSGFELELERNLKHIALHFSKGHYQLMPLRPMPFPKHPDKQGKPRVRQVFQISVRDQVAWTAVVNVLGPFVDSKMPAWSYGNRLYRSIWLDPKSDIKRRKIGNYRHAAGHLYLPFRQSWPIFRRHVYLTTRAMTNINNLPGMDERTEEERIIQDQLSQKNRCPYLSPDYWEDRRKSQNGKELYWCSIDLEKFYPTLKLQVVNDNIVSQLPIDWQEDASRLLKGMLRFPLNLNEWDNSSDLKAIGLNERARIFSHVPTGLYVAGFLANAGLLKVDLEVEQLLLKRDVAHFRYVDDHVFIAYSFEDLIAWVKEYANVLVACGTGLKINWEKVEPEEFSEFMKTDENKYAGEKIESARQTAGKACELDPEFPSPLMTKTLAMVSTIARTDFNLLEPGELAALTDQLEHLLLVELPEDEIPEKTRLSFAATRLTYIVECRLGNDESLTSLGCREEQVKYQLNSKDLPESERSAYQQELDDLQKEIGKQEKELKNEVLRVFQLLRKVLRNRSDRTRLWTRAITMCRIAGVNNGLENLLNDMRREQKSNPLLGEYLRASMSTLLGTQALIASRILNDNEIAHWKKHAAQTFFTDLLQIKMEAPSKNDRWYLHTSWQQYCVGVYCAVQMLNDETVMDKVSTDLINTARRCITKGSLGHGAARWTWWVARKSLADLSPRASKYVNKLGQALPPSHETNAFWRFFPLDVPDVILKSMSIEPYPLSSTPMDGWWYDALASKGDAINAFPVSIRRPEIGRVIRVLNLKNKRMVSMYEWCSHLFNISINGTTDPRTSEWTALEIIRQIAALIAPEQTLQQHLRDTRRTKNSFPWIHPSNFRVPREWMQENELTWEGWHKLVRQKNISYLSKPNRIIDGRYTPITDDKNSFFKSVNPVHGLGILLYGLLKKDFNLPTIWNGPGHADVLGLLPKLLLADITCSSWTLGVLQGCLLPRTAENIYLKMANFPVTDDDTLHDPKAFTTPQEVAQAVEKCQNVLEKYQLSTLNNKARQLTPVSIKQLTDPE